MKVSYYDLFDMIAEDAGKLLSQAEQSPIHPENYSPDTTIAAVSGKIKETKRHKKRTQKNTFRLRLLSDKPHSQSVPDSKPHTCP